MRLISLTITLGVLAYSCACNDKGSDVIIPTPAYYGTYASWSPQDNLLAVVWTGDPTVRKKGIYLLDTLDWSTKPIYVTDNWGDWFGVPAWSPSGDRLAFPYNKQIYKIKSNGDSLTQLTFSQENTACDWAWSDTLIAYHASMGDSSGIWTIGSSGGLPSYLVRYGSAISFVNGDSILYLEGIPPNWDSARVVIINPADSGVREIGRWSNQEQSALVRDPDYDSTQKRLVLSVDRRVHLLHMDEFRYELLCTDLSSYPSWSPDARSIIYTRPTVEGGELWIMDSDGSNRRIVPNWATRIP